MTDFSIEKEILNGNIKYENIDWDATIDNFCYSNEKNIETIEESNIIEENISHYDEESLVLYVDNLADNGHFLTEEEQHISTLLLYKDYLVFK